MHRLREEGPERRTARILVDEGTITTIIETNIVIYALAVPVLVSIYRRGKFARAGLLELSDAERKKRYIWSASVSRSEIGESMNLFAVVESSHKLANST